MNLFSKSLVLLLSALSAGILFAADLKPISIWSGHAPGNSGATGAEKDMTTGRDGLVAGKSVIRLGNVTDPTITVYSPEASRNTRTAVLVCPGGGYHILAMDLEGTEVCEWLNSLGVTAVLLKYRVPTAKGQADYAAPLQDAQRALGLIRQHAAEWNINPKRVGVLGFSAGGNLSASLSTNYEKRTYDAIDGADSLSCRPDFTVLIYPAYLAAKGEGNQLRSELKVDSHTPPAFITQTEDDGVGVENSLDYYLALTHQKVPAELHLYATGGHGYGLRKTEKQVTNWPQFVEKWFDGMGLLKN